MHITLEADYAVRIVGCLAQEKKRMDANALSGVTCVTLRFSLKILRKLVAAGIVKSYKGVQGGYELAKKPSEISLKDVIEAVEGRYTLSKCLSDSYECSRGMSGKCCFQRVFNEISVMVDEKLAEYTFDRFADT
ncbi:MAG: Rrf2 family transcriptional regulator [Oscillospiraceae bacterium]|nr:Rrf2 family transcriptional regulator [Oscillospiraceae bacterium]